MMTAPYKLTSAELGYTSSQILVAVEANATSTPIGFDASHPLAIATSGKADFQLFTVSEVIGGWALLGEPSKWVGVSEARFANVAFDDQVMRLQVCS
jgi:hypothetical protein